MKLRISAQEFGPKYACYDESVIDGAPDAGEQLVGYGDTKVDARADFMDKWMERQSQRDVAAAIKQMRIFDEFLSKAFGGKA